MRERHVIAPVVCALLLWASPASSEAQGDDRMAALLQPLTAGRERYAVEAIGLTAGGRRVIALEPALPPVANQRRVVLVAGLDGSDNGTRAVLEVLTSGVANGTAFSNRRRWQVAAMPCALPDGCAGQPTEVRRRPRRPSRRRRASSTTPRAPEARYVWRWVAMVGPDLVVEVRDGPCSRGSTTPSRTAA